MDTRNKIFVVVGTVAILGTAGVVGALLFTEQDAAQETTAVTTSQTSSSSSSTANSSTATANYNDGTYSATQTYSVPHGDSNSIRVTITISSGIITAATTDDSYADHESGEYIDSFKNSLSAVIVGQNLDSTPQSRIGGASLTTQAFYDALETIAEQAKA